jgi:phospholipid/cholesterol/gamma-HCH transport system permease protein
MMADAEVSFLRASDATLVVALAGAWQIRRAIPDPEVVRRELEAAPLRRLRFDASRVTAWDSSLLIFLARVTELCTRPELTIERDGLPVGLQRLWALSEAVPERPGARQTSERQSWLGRIGMAVIAAQGPLEQTLGFIGNILQALGRLLRGRARFRIADLLLLVQQAGAQALGIITLISFLVGLILAFVGAIQLEQFGASIYVANLVGIAIVREMGAMMTGIVMAGRTGAAYAAQIGTMKVTQEIDALTTMGISSLDFIVLPRMIALCVMMPVLCLYADLLGILGGAAVGSLMLKIPFLVYYNQTAGAVDITDLVGGVFKASVYGVLIAIAGCLRGLQCGNSSSAVGDAATSAVVTGIVSIIVACGVFAVIFYILGI